MNNVICDGLWKLNNVMGFMYIIYFEDCMCYVFVVIVWNRWGESLLENDKMLYIYIDFMDGIIIKMGKIIVIFEIGEVCVFIYYIFIILFYCFL